MSQVSPCPYCGHIGYHMWAGSGGCPGAVPERERDATAAVYLQTLSEQNRRLRAQHEDEIKRLKALCAQAADAIYREQWPLLYKDLIAELRKAAQ